MEQEQEQGGNTNAPARAFGLSAEQQQQPSRAALRSLARCTHQTHKQLLAPL